MGTAISSGPAIGDLDHNLVNGLEIVFSAGDALLTSFATGVRLPKRRQLHGLTPLPNNPLNAVFVFLPAIGTLTGTAPTRWFDGRDGSVYVLSAGEGPGNGAYATGGLITSSPALIELKTASPGLEIVIGSGNGTVYALMNAGGHLLWSRPLGAQVTTSPRRGRH